MKKLLDFIKHRKSILTLGFLLFLGVIISYLSRGFFFLGGEGNYFLDFSLVRDIYRYTWNPLMAGIGSSNPLLNFSFGIFDFFSFLQKIGLSFKFINLLSIILIYALPFIAIYWLLKVVLKLDSKIALLVSLFYILNPFSTEHLQGMMFWNVAPLFTFPLIFGIIYKYYFDKLKLFFIFGIVTSILSFSLANIPYLGIFHILLLISIIIISYLHKNEFDYKIALKNFFILEISFIIFNAWWLINLIRYYFQELNVSTFSSSIVNWIVQYYANDQGIINKIFTLTPLLTNVSGYFLPTFYSNNFVNIILYIPIVILIVSFIFKTNQRNKSLIISSLFLLLIFFLDKGANEPFGFVYIWMLRHVPLFDIFNAPTEKFSVLFVFLFALALAFALKTYKKRTIYYVLGIYLLVCTVPYITLNFMPDYPLGNNQYMSRLFTDKQEYKDVRNMINAEKLDYRVLSLPGSLNYQVTMANHDNKYYRGMDPILYAINKSFIAAYSSPEIENIVFHNLSNPKLNDLLSLYNIKEIMLNNDIVPSFGFAEKESSNELDKMFSQNMTKWISGSMDLYSYDTFLPHFYIPRTIITTTQDPDILPQIVSQPDYNIRSAIYFNDQSNASETVSGTPVIEFKKIDPTKYRVIIHGATADFPLVFSESFDNGWRDYLVDYKKDQINFNASDYKILDGNEDDQASTIELQGYIQNSWISDLGKGSTDFISKDFNGTIQNNNLENGSFYETWFQKPVDDNANHQMVNGYANSWTIDPNEVCLNNAKCVKNADGSYDMEFVIEFWPQRLFYVGLGISGAALVGCLGYLIFVFFRKNRKIASSTTIEEKENE